MNKPFKTYLGGKEGAGTFQTIINQIPRHEIYIEPMVGNGAIFRNIYPAQRIIISDIDPAITSKYAQLKRDGAIHRHTTVILGNYLDTIVFFKYEENAFWYFDPPYMLSTRLSTSTKYKYDWNDDEHEQFLQAAQTITERVAISHYPCKLYDETLKNWRTVDYMSQTRGGQKLERLYMNYPEPEHLHDYRYIGTDNIDRQRIKRKRTRIVGKVKRLPQYERLALLQELHLKGLIS